MLSLDVRVSLEPIKIVLLAGNEVEWVGHMDLAGLCGFRSAMKRLLYF